MGFEKIDFADKNIIGFDAKGKITEEDYTKTLFPIFDKARKSGKKLKLLLRFGPDFKGYTFDAMWEDSKFGLRYMRTIERAAVVTDLKWLSRMARFFGSLVPCPIKIFNCGQTEAAKAWIEQGKSGLEHTLNEATKVLTVKVSSPLSSEDFEVMSDVVDSYIERSGTLQGIVIWAEKFPGWENFGSFISHFEFVKEHHKLVERVALVADGEIAKKLPAIGKHFVDAKLKYFEADQLADAQEWASGQDLDVVPPFHRGHSSEESMTGKIH